MTSPKTKTAHGAKAAAVLEQAGRARRDRRILAWAAAAAAAALLVGALYWVFASAGAPASKGAYEVGQPGPGTAAPGFSLASSTGKSVSLSEYRGKTVLLYFQEGLTCQPCWDQLKDLEKDPGQLKAAGIDQVLSVTTDPADLITRKAHDLGLATPVLSDPDLAVSKAYHANEYGMMGTSRDGHTFVLVGPDGAIRWRADYGGAPKYTMYVPPAQLLADLKAGEK